MIPAVRAVADRFILDTANVKYVAANLPAGSLERIVEETGWTIRQTLAHVAVSLENYANALKWLVEGVEPDRTGRYPWPRNAEVAALTATTPLPEIIGLLDVSLARIVASCEQIDESTVASMLAGQPLLDVLKAWSCHPADHGLDLADTLPEIRFDPMVLNWLLHADFSDSPERAVRQARLMTEVRERFAGERANAS